jgi:hypothetical protein
MLAILFYRIPFGSPAWRINLLSVVLAASGAFLHFLTILRWELWLAFDPAAADAEGPAAASARGRRLQRVAYSACAALVGTGLQSFCPLIWMYSIQAEVSHDGGGEQIKGST